MVLRRLQEAPLLIRDRYRGVLDSIMAHHNIEPLQRPGHVVRANASFTEVVQNTDWFCWRADQVQYRPYRYRRYREVLGYLGQPDRRLAHVDIGCGAGAFSWALLDWAQESGLSYDRLDLYGLDHSPEMINLAQRMRDGLALYTSDYPDLRYTHDVEALLLGLTEGHQAGTDYLITLGHVLAQSHTNDAILNFTRVIVYILELLDTRSDCVLMAVDARNWPAAFTEGWDLLLDNLTGAGVRHEIFAIQQSYINDNNRVRIAGLFPAGRQGG